MKYMNDKQNWNDVGDQIKDALQGALESGDFKQLNNVVSGTVSSALDEAKRQMKMAAEDAKEQAKEQGNNWAGSFRNPKFKDTFHYNNQTNNWTNSEANTTNNSRMNSRTNSFTYNQSAYNQAVNQNKRNRSRQEQRQRYDNYAPTVRSHSHLPAVRTNKVGSVSGTLYIVFGGIGTGIASLGLIVEAIMMFAGVGIYGTLVQVFGWTSLLFLASLYMIRRGSFKKDRLKRADRYVQLAGGNLYVNIEDLALQLHKSKRRVLKDIRKMLSLGIFPEGHLDAEGTCLMLSDATYREYLDLRKKRRIQEEEARLSYKTVESTPVQTAETAESENPELDALMAEGAECIRRLRDMNDDIEGEVISAKLYQLENLLKQIFDRVKEHPEQMPQMQKFMSYYLPTTLKIVSAYADFDDIVSPGEDIRTAKNEIEKTLDTINAAFSELLNNLLRDTAFDVTTDAQVLSAMLAREGLTREMEPEFIER